MHFPSEICKQNGIYRVSHYRHRFSHDVVITEGTQFPPCKKCGYRVKFELVERPRDRSQVVPIVADEDFGMNGREVLGEQI